MIKIKSSQKLKSLSFFPFLLECTASQAKACDQSHLLLLSSFNKDIIFLSITQVFTLINNNNTDSHPTRHCGLLTCLCSMTTNAHSLKCKIKGSTPVSNGYFCHSSFPSLLIVKKILGGNGRKYRHCKS